MNVKKLLLSALTLIFTVAFTYAQTAATTPDVKGKTKAEGIIKAINAMVTNKAIAEKKPAADPKALLSAAQKQGITKACIGYEMGLDTMKMRSENLKKSAAEMQTKAGEINTKVAAINALAGKTVETEEEGAKVKAEIDKGNEEVNKMKADLDQMKANIAKEQEDIGKYKETLEPRRDDEIKKVLNAEQNKFYEEIKAKQKAKKGS